MKTLLELKRLKEKIEQIISEKSSQDSWLAFMLEVICEKQSNENPLSADAVVRSYALAKKSGIWDDLPICDRAFIEDCLEVRIFCETFCDYLKAEVSAAQNPKRYFSAFFALRAYAMAKLSGLWQKFLSEDKKLIEGHIRSEIFRQNWLKDIGAELQIVREQSEGHVGAALDALESYACAILSDYLIGKDARSEIEDKLASEEFQKDLIDVIKYHRPNTMGAAVDNFLRLVTYLEIYLDLLEQKYAEVKPRK